MLPIDEALPDLRAALAAGNTAVLVAPPGAGKTTVLPLALKDEAWATAGRLVLLEPRRLAARAAAARMASTLAEPVGRTVGLRMRGETRVAADTRIEVVTEGVFTRMILDDPGLEGVAGVLFDEFHERSLDADLGLAFARDAQALLRADLRLLVMSATLDGARISRLLGGAPVIQSEGRAHPVETRYLGRDRAGRLETDVVRAVRRALAEEGGSILVFLPGAGEIRRVHALLYDELAGPRDVLVAPLYGALDFAEQRRAIEPAPAGRRKVVLATSIAETSLTIEGVRVVIDAGYARVPRYEPATGMTRLATVRVSRASADQRRGRAGRTEPGVCYRLWDEAETRGLVPFDRPEILESDLAGVALDLARWGVRSAESLALLDPPPAAAVAEAQNTLVRLGALDGKGALTDQGRRVAELPLPPRLGHMVLLGSEHGQALRAAQIAAVLAERGLGGTDPDLGSRLERFAADHSPRAEQARRLAERWARQAGEGAPAPGSPRLSDGALLASAFPDWIARAKGGSGRFLLASGRAAVTEATHSLAQSEWLAVGEVRSAAAADRIALAAPLTEAEVLALFVSEIVSSRSVSVDSGGRVRVRLTRRLGLIELEVQTQPPTPAEVPAALTQQVQLHGLAVLKLPPEAERLRERIAFLRSLDEDAWPDLGDAVLTGAADEWLGPLLDIVLGLDDVEPAALLGALWARVGPERRRELDRLAPERWTTPAGASHPIDYAAEGGPRVEVRVQELFGLREHPTIAGGRTPLVLSLLSPAHRPVQLTRDLPGFWSGSWKAVRTEMRGRYPKHPWPEDPLTAVPTTRAKPRGT